MQLWVSQQPPCATLLQLSCVILGKKLEFSVPPSSRL